MRGALCVWRRITNTVIPAQAGMTVLLRRQVDADFFMIANVIISAFLFYLSFPNYWNLHGLWPLAWIALVPFFASIDGKSISIRFLIGIFYGIVSYSLLLQWLWPVHWAGTVLLVLAMAIGPVVFALLYRPINQPLWDCVYVPALWVASEWARTITLKGFCWGLGYSQSFEPALIQLASWTGPYGVGFVIVFVNHCLYQSLKTPLKRKMYIGLAASMFLIVYTTGLWSIRTHEKETEPLLVCAIQPNISPVKKLSLKDFDDNIQSQVTLTEKALLGRPVDMIVWPETSFGADVFKDSVWYPRLKEISVENNAVFLFGAVPFIKGESFNSAVVLDQKGNLAGIHHKQFLVPISEYQPKWIAFSIFRNILNNHRFNFTPGKKHDAFNVTGEYRRSFRFGTVICSETCYPSLSRKLAQEGAGFIIAILNDGWFNQPAALMMHAENAIMRAVESGLDIVSVGNTGWTFQVNARGVIDKSQGLPLQKVAYGTFRVSGQGKPTMYCRIGDFFAKACTLFVIMFLIFQRRKFLKKL
mgnify:CR=1 FL=1